MHGDGAVALQREAGIAKVVDIALKRPAFNPIHQTKAGRANRSSRALRFAKNLTHRFSRNAALRSIVARVPPFADVSG